jgi:predicted nucleic acid-binding Zn ribbon protein
MDSLMEKHCIECGEIIRGRSDKKFCSDQCRTSFNNQLKQETNGLVKKITYTLRKNRRILLELNPNGKTKIHRKTLLDLGFNFNYYTNMYKTKNGNTYYFCYEHGYLVIDDGFLALVVNNQFFGDHKPQNA